MASFTVMSSFASTDPKVPGMDDRKDWAEVLQAMQVSSCLLFLIVSR